MRKLYVILVLACCLLALSNTTSAQISKGGVPPSISLNTAIDPTIDEVTIAPIDVAQAMLEDSLKGGPYWIGRGIQINYNMNNSGSWTTLPDGRSIWRLKLTSPGAKALSLNYQNFFIPEGGQLFLYNGYKNQVIGAFTSDNNTPSGLFSTELIQGESVTLEYVAPAVMPEKTDPNGSLHGTFNGDHFVASSAASNLSLPQINISEIVYVYREVSFLARYDLSRAPQFGASGTCEVNVNCSEGASWQTQKRGVAEIYIKNGTNYGFCTGSLITTANNNGTPYFLTADHCHGMPNAPAPDTEPFASAPDMLLWQFYFKYESPTCTNPGSSPAYSTLTGCTLVASSPVDGGSDFCLLQLQSSPPQSYNPYYNGWDRTLTAPTSGVGIHHPAGDIKKISTFTATATTGTFNGGTGLTCATNVHWNVIYVQTTNGHGVVEGGSSGSPLFNQSGKIVGTLSGGSSDCSNLTGSNLYGKIYYHWDQMGTNANQRLKPWLDPSNSGSTTVNGYDPYNGYPDFYGTPTTIYEGQTVTFTDITNGATSWSWVFDGGTPATSSLQNPTITFYQQGTYTVKLTTVTPTAGQQTMEKVAYITVLPGPQPTSIWCDDFSTPSNWTRSTSGGYTDSWKITNVAPGGTYAASMGKISSTSGGNYALFNSDSMGASGDNQWAHLTTTNGINCTNYGTVILNFQENYKKFYDSTLVYVSTDNFVTSKRYVVNGDFANNTYSGNPKNISVDISNAAAGKTNVKVRFTFRSTQDMSTAAGWGYAWEIDDVCLTGIAPGNDLPVPDFTATTTTEISPGQSVSFQDLSAYATSWLWTFEGGTPATSTAQNPTGIVYNTGGYYKVTLAATNQNGTVATTKTDYIHVYDDCSYDESNILATDDITYYGAPGTYWGYVPGHNGETILSYAEKIDIGTLSGKVKSLAVAVAEADSMGGTTTVTFNVYANAGGVPGSVLGSRTVPVSNLDAGYINYIDLTPISVSGTYFVGFDITYPANPDTFACYLATGNNRTNTAYVKVSGVWQTLETKYGINGSLYILPEFCLDQASTHKPDADFYASQTTITPGTSISFYDQSTGGPAPTSWLWSLSGGSPTAPTVQNPPTVLYSTAGLYDASLTATNANGSNTKVKGGYIHVAPVANIAYWNFPSNPDNATIDGGDMTINTGKTISISSTLATLSFASAGASTNSASCVGWNDAVASNYDYWLTDISTVGYTDIKVSSKQSAVATGSPRDFALYYSIDGSNINFVCDVPAMTTAGSWTQGVLNNVSLPAECNNQASVLLLWLKTTDYSAIGGTISGTAASRIDDILVKGQKCTQLPAAPGTITGTATVCQGQTGVTYTVPNINYATIYNWTVPTGATIVSGQYTNSIVVDYALNQAAGNITVQGENMCGSGTVSTNYPITVNPVPVAPSPITGIQSVSNGQNGVAYSVPVVSGASTYTWTLPSFATQASGGTTNNITVNFACPGDFGNISVHANNACGAGPESYAKTITINCPPVANFYANQTTLCPGGSVVFTDISTNNPTTWSWTFTGGTPASSTIEHPTVVYSAPGTYAVTLTVTNANGSDSETKTGYITVSSPSISFTNVNENPAGACNGTSTVNASGSTSPYTYSWSAIDRTYTFTGSTSSTEAGTSAILNNGTRNFTAAVTGVGNLDGITYSFDRVCTYITEGRDRDLVMSLISPAGTTVALTAQNSLSGVNIGNGTTQVCFKQSATSAITAGTAPYTASPGPNWKPAGTGDLTTYHNGQSPTGNWTFRIQDASATGSDGVLNNWTLYFTSHVVNSTQTITNLCSGNYTVTVTDANGCTASQTTTITVSTSVSASISASTNVNCYGGSTGSATVTATGGTSPYTYDWSPNGFTGDGTATYSGLTAGTYTVTVTDAVAGTATASVTITQSPQLTATISGQTNATCSFSTNGSATVGAAGGTSPYTYDWAPNGYTGDGTVTYSALIPGTYTVTVSDNKSCTATNTVTITALNADAPASVSIAASPSGAICAGTSVTFTATPTNGGTTPVYQWKLNGVNVGTNSATYTNASLANGNVVTCQMTSNATCATGSPATSNSITMTVNAIPSVTASATPATICSGSSSSLTASGASTYVWSNSLGSTATVSASPTSTTTYTVTGTSAGCAGTATVTVTVNSTVTAGVSIAASPSGAICAGTSVTFTATPTNGGTTPVYQWKVNGGNVGTNSATYASTTLANTDIVSCTMTSNATCVTGSPANSNNITMVVNPVLTPSVSIAITSGSNPACSGSSVTFTATPTNGGTTPGYQWKVNGTNVGTNSTTYTTSALTNGQVVTCVMTSNATCASPTTATSNSITMTINSTVTPSVSITLTSGTNPSCAGSSVTFTATPANGGTTPVYQWKVNGSNVGTNSATYTTSALTNGQVVTCDITSNASCASPTTATSNSITMTINAVVTPSVSIALTSGSNPSCSGSSVTFTATPTNGGTTPAYQWKVNGGNVGTNSATYTTSALTNGQVVSCVMTSNASCASPTTATSNNITMTINTAVTPSVSIALTSGSNPSCAGSSVTFTATPTNGGTTPAYQWRVNGSAVGTNSATYTTTGLTNGQVVTCDMTSNATCASPTTASSNSITMTINAVVTPSVSIALTSGSNPTCAGSSVTFTATPTNGGTTPAYQWRVNGTAVGTNSTTYTTTALTNGQVVTCDMTSNATCASPTMATSNSITMTINAVVTPSVSIALTSGSNPSCAGSSVTFTATPTNGGTTPVYQWRVNGTAVGTNSTTYTTSALTNGQVVTCDMTSNATCASPTTASSNSITMTINAVVTPSVSIALTSGSNPSCAGSSVTFTATPTNGGTTPAYQWRVNGIAAGTNSATYTTTALTNGQVVTCDMTSNATCASPTTASSNSITMTINATVTPSVSIALTSGSNPSCSGASITFTATPTNGGSTPVYQWRVNGGAVGTNSATYTTSALTNGQVVTCDMTSNATCASPTTVSSNSITMTINATVTPSVSIALTSGSNPSCAGSSLTFTATPTNGGTTPAYQWQVNGVNAGTNANTFTTSSLTNGQVVSCILTSNATCASPTTATSNSITMTINPVLTPSATISQTAGSNPMCSGASATFTVVPTNGGTTPAYQWQVNGSNVGTNSTTYTTTGLTNGQIVSCILTSNATCASPTTATSNTITMTVNSTLVPSVSIAVTAGSNPTCAGASMTFTATPVNGGTTPSYQWKVDGSNVGTNSSTYTTSALTNGQVVSCTMTSSSPCASPTTANSNNITITVNATLVPAVSIALTSGSNPACAGSSLTFTATPVNGGATPSYAWKVNGAAAGTNSPTFTTSSITNGQVVSCVMTSSSSCASPTTATSNNITMTINPVLTPSVTVALTTGSNPSCSGSSLTFTATPTNGGTTPSYQWMVNGVNVGTNSPTFTSAGITNGQVVNCILTSNATCASPATATSNNVTMTINSSVTPSVSIAVTSGSNPSCAGSSVTLTATPTNGGASPSYLWYVNGTSTGITTATYTTSSLTDAQVVSCVMTSNATCASPLTATSNNITMSILPTVVPSVTIALTSGSNPTCTGSSVTFTATPVNGGTTPTYAWKVDGSAAGTNSPTFTTSALTNGQVVSCVITSNAGCASPVTATSNLITMTVNSTLTPSVSVALTSGSNPSCSGSALTFTATPTNGGSTPAYQWMVNGVNVGTNSATYTSSGITNGQIVNCIMTSNAACASPLTATSNNVTMTINSSVTPSVTIALTSGTNPSCAGSSLTFTATPVNGGTTPSYQWQVNGVNAGTNAATFTTSSLTNGQVVSCIMTSNAGCASPLTANSNNITVTVNPVVSPTVSIALTTGSNPSCSGSTLTYTASPVNGGSSPVYAWYVDATSVGTNSPTFTTSSLTNGQTVACVLTSNATCASPTITGSNIITQTVNSTVVPSVSIALTSGSNPGCAGSSMTFTATPVNGGTTPSYQWLVNGSNAGTNSATFTTSSLTNGQVVSCVMTSNAGCASPLTATSSGITVTINSVVVPSVSIALTAGSNPSCAGSAMTFTASPVNGGTTPSYQWQVNGVNAGTNSPTFTSSSLSNLDVVNCIMTSGIACASPVTATATGITVNITPVSPASVSIAASPAGIVCAGTNVTFTATPVNGGTPTYQWRVNGVGVATGSSYASSGLNNGDVVSCTMTSSLACVSGSPATSNSITMNVSPVAPVSVSVLNNPTGTVCPGTNMVFVAVANNGGSTPAYQWLVNGTPNGVTTMSFNSSALADGDQVSCIVTSNAACATGNPATSNVVTVSVSPVVAAGITITANPAGAICEGTPVTLTANPTAGGVTPAYQWVVNGVVAGTGSTYSSSSFADNDQVICVMASNASCVTGSPAISNPVILDVNPILAVGVSISASPSGQVCAGTNVSFTASPIDAGANPNYQWVVNGINVGGNSPVYSNSTLSTGDQVSCILTATAPCATGSPATSNVITMDVAATNAVSASISATPAGAICAGTPVTFTANVVNGGTTPVYQWMVNGAYAGTNSANFATSGIANGDNVYCIVTSNIACPTGSPATSNTLAMTVNPNLPVSISIASDAATAVCEGSLITFTATPVNEGVSPSYQWMVNGSNTGTDSPVFASSTLANGDIVSCKLTSSEVCATGSPAVSNPVVVAVTTNVPVGVSVQTIPSNVICVGDEVTFSAIPVNSGTSPVYQWYLNGSPVGANASTYISSSLNNGDQVYCELTSSIACVSGSPATSAVTTVTVNPIPAAEAGDGVTTCSNVPAQLIASGGDTYAWSNGMNNDTISVNPQSSVTYYVTVTSNGCSAIDFVDVLVLTAPTVDLGADQIICGNQTVTLDAGAGQSYLWSTGATTQTLAVDSTHMGLGAFTYNVDVTSFNGCHGYDTVTITVQTCAGISENEGTTISYYPNPVHGMLTIQLSGEITEDINFSIIDMLGQTTYRDLVKSGSNIRTFTIDMSSYADGVYYLNIQTGDKSWVNKIVVN